MANGTVHTAIELSIILLLRFPARAILLAALATIDLASFLPSFLPGPRSWRDRFLFDWR